MATQDDRRRVGGEKASALKAGDGISRSDNRPQGRSRRHSDREMQGEIAVGRRSFSLRALVADLVLLVLLVAIGIGAIFGYRALKAIYDPEWETRQVEFSVKIVNVDEKTVNTFIYDEDGNNLFENSELYHTDRVDGNCLGIVKEVKVEPGATTDTFILDITVVTEASYRTGEGYYVHDTQLLAGTVDQYRVHGMTFEGIVTAMHEME